MLMELKRNISESHKTEVRLATITTHLPADVSTPKASGCAPFPWQLSGRIPRRCTVDRETLPDELRNRILPDWTGSPCASQTDPSHFEHIALQTLEVLQVCVYR